MISDRQTGSPGANTPVPVPVPVLPLERFPHAALLSRALPAARCGPRCSPAGTLLQVRVAVQQSAGGPAVMLRSRRVIPLSHHWKRQKEQMLTGGTAAEGRAVTGACQRGAGR